MAFRYRSFLGGLLLILAAAQPAGADEATHGIAMHGQPKYAKGFAHFDYVNPDAPKGGELRLPAGGSFDSLNPFIVKGTAPVGLRGNVFESLMARSYDEPFSLYGLIAEKIEVPDDRTSITFTLRENARFSDGEPVTVDDVLYSWEALRTEGRPNYRTYYNKVSKAEQTGPRSVTFTIGPDIDREMPLILGLMPILPRHIYEVRGLDKASLDTPVGSGPYTVAEVEPGSRITYQRNPDYWGEGLNVNLGHNNPDRITYEFYRNATSAFEAFKKGLTDIRIEDDPGDWAEAYSFPAALRGEVQLLEVPVGLPSGMKGFAMNTRRAPFDDKLVREAMILLFDFEWMNEKLYHGQYVRTESFYDESELASVGRPASPEERALLAPYTDWIDPEILEEGYVAPVSDGAGSNRANRRAAYALLKEAGYRIRSGVFVNPRTGKPLSFEILVDKPIDERLALAFANLLKRDGIEAEVRYVDASQYQTRLDDYDFDMMLYQWDASLSPGNEQSFYWSSDAADRNGTRNYMGAKSPAVDAMIGALLEAKSREDFVTAARALDRALLSGAYVIPLFHAPNMWIAHWNRVAAPETPMLWGYRPQVWWVEEAAD